MSTAGRRPTKGRADLGPVLLALLLILPTSLAASPLAERITENDVAGTEVPHTARVDPVLLDALDTALGDPVTAIAVHAPDATSEAEAAYHRHDVTFTALPRLEMAILRLDAERLHALAAEPAIRSLWAPPEIEMLLDEAAPTVGAPAARADFGVNGTGVRVLVSDTGVDGLHPDLKDRIHGNWYYGYDSWIDPLGIPYTDTSIGTGGGHGTAVIGTLAGMGVGLGPHDPSHDRYIGIAPGADIISCTTSTGLGPLLCLERALEDHETYDIRVSSNSWGTMGPPFDPEHPINHATLALYRAGIAVVFASGNSGTPSGCDGTMNTFASAPWALSVVAADKDHRLASFSSQGTDPDACGDPFDHPTITAPGASIMAAKARAGAIQATSPFSYDGNTLDLDLIGSASYGYVSGTSISAPIVAGALALLFEANPELAPDQAYDILVATAQPLAHAYPWWQAGAGLLDAHAAVQAAIETPGTLDAFLAGERRYDDPNDAMDEPLKRHLAENDPVGPGIPDDVPTYYLHSTDRFRVHVEPGVHEVRLVANETFVLSEILHETPGGLVTVIHPEDMSLMDPTCGGLAPGVFAHRGPLSVGLPAIETAPSFPAGNYSLLVGTDRFIEVRFYVNTTRDTLPLAPLSLADTRPTDHTATFLRPTGFDLTDVAPLSARFTQPLTLHGPSIVLTTWSVNPEGAGQDEMHSTLTMDGTPCATVGLSGTYASAPFFGPFRELTLAGSFPEAGEIEWHGEYTLTAGLWATTPPYSILAALTLSE